MVAFLSTAVSVTVQYILRVRFQYYKHATNHFFCLFIFTWCWTHTTHLKPTESRWHHIFWVLVWIPGGCSNSTWQLFSSGSASTVELLPENSPSCPPIPHAWRREGGHFCWPFQFLSHSQGQSQCQLFQAPMDNMKTTISTECSKSFSHHYSHLVS